MINCILLPGHISTVFIFFCAFSILLKDIFSLRAYFQNRKKLFLIDNYFCALRGEEHTVFSADPW